jgi:Uri superfamily endonuclease
VGGSVDGLPAVPSRPGTYILLLEIPRETRARVGRLGRLAFEPGLYGYVGSALGPGGLAARLRRHAAGTKRRHWHVDRLSSHARVSGALWIEGRRRRECAWASWVRRVAVACVEGFGSSDCRCAGHLFLLGPRETEESFVRRARRDLRALYAPRAGFGNPAARRPVGSGVDSRTLDRLS